LDNFSLNIKKGEKIGIVGISGTGKSTLFKLLLKLYNPDKGEIKFDNISLKDIKRTSYIKNITIAPQETELFNLSLKDNIIIGNKKTDEKKLKKSLEIAHVNDFLYKLPKGIDSLIGEKGTRLSGGEKQRVGIARAIYRNSNLLLLDEATSHLDTISENKIQDALHKSLQDITAIVIAHRLSTIKGMDRIIVIRNGKIIEQGNFKNLINNKKDFYELWKKQQF
jgi:ATP-binding cassette subfamily B protein